MPLLPPLGTSGHPRGLGATKYETGVNTRDGLTARLAQVLGPRKHGAGLCRHAVPTEVGRRGFVTPYVAKVHCWASFSFVVSTTRCCIPPLPAVVCVIFFYLIVAL